MIEDESPFTKRQEAYLQNLIQRTLECSLNTLLDKREKEVDFRSKVSLSEKEELTQKEVCEYFELTKQTVIGWEKAGKLKGTKVGKFRYYNKKDILFLFEMDRLRSKINYVKTSSPYYRIEVDQNVDGTVL